MSEHLVKHAEQYHSPERRLQLANLAVREVFEQAFDQVELGMCSREEALEYVATKRPIIFEHYGLEAGDELTA
jgi:hypothetical protein